MAFPWAYRTNCVARVGGPSCRREPWHLGSDRLLLLMTDLRERMVAMTVRAGRGWEEMIERDHQVLGDGICADLCVKSRIRIFSWRNKTRQSWRDT